VNLGKITHYLFIYSLLIPCLFSDAVKYKCYVMSDELGRCKISGSRGGEYEV
jgi:hypothetical protein